MNEMNEMNAREDTRYFLGREKAIFKRVQAHPEETISGVMLVKLGLLAGSRSAAQLDLLEIQFWTELARGRVIKTEKSAVLNAIGRSSWVRIALAADKSIGSGKHVSAWIERYQLETKNIGSNVSSVLFARRADLIRALRPRVEQVPLALPVPQITPQPLAVPPSPSADLSALFARVQNDFNATIQALHDDLSDKIKTQNNAMRSIFKQVDALRAETTDRLNAQESALTLNANERQGVRAEIRQLQLKMDRLLKELGCDGPA